jgi:hypothetical protein
MNALKAMAAAGLAGLTMIAAAGENDFEHGQPSRLVGVWQITSQLLNCATGQPLPVAPFQALIAFHAGGTSTESAVSATPRTPGLGNWSRTGRNTYVGGAIVLVGDANGLPNGSIVVRRDITLSADGMSFVAATRSVVTDASGVATNRCALGTATRFE